MDPISDMFCKIKNAQAVWHPTVDVVFSKIKYEIAAILEREGFVERVEKKKKKFGKIGKIKPVIEIGLKYLSQEEGPNSRLPRISGVKVVSGPGQRIYVSHDKIRKIRGGYGIAIISTSKGIMTNKDARKNKVGGEIICEVW